MSTARQAPAVEMDLARRLERALGKAGEELDWKVGERVRRQVRFDAALAAGGARATKAATEMDKIAARLGRAGASREMARIAALWRVRGSASGPREVRELLNEMVEALRPAIPFEGATAFVYEKASAHLTPVVVAGSHVDLIPDIHFDCGAGFSSWVAKTRRPVLLSSFREDPIGVPVERPASFLSVPLLVDDELVAVLNFAHRRPGTFTTADRDLVILAGRLVAAALSKSAPEAAWAAPAVEATAP